MAEPLEFIAWFLVVLESVDLNYLEQTLTPTSTSFVDVSLAARQLVFLYY